MSFNIRLAQPQEYQVIGQLLVDAYSRIENFPKPHELPTYFGMLANVGELTKNEGTEIFVATDADGAIRGAVVYIGIMKHYGSRGLAPAVEYAAGFRLLAVDPSFGGQGIGKQLTLACLDKARADGKQQVVIHTTHAMLNAWKMYEKIGFKRSEDLDFEQANVYVSGFRFQL